MAYGFSSMNDNGFIQIDSDFSNIALISAGSYNQTTFDSYNYQISEYDFYFIRPSVAGQYISAYTYKGNDNLLYIAITVYSSVQGENCVVDFLRCRGSKDVYITPPNSSYGFNVMRADETVAYSSEIISPQVTNVLSVNTASLTVEGSNSLNYSVAAPATGKKRYFGVNSFSTIGNLEWSPDFGSTMYTEGSYLSASNTSNTRISVKCSTPWIEGLVYWAYKLDTINQLIVVDY